MKSSSVVIVILCTCSLVEAIREELNVADVNSQNIKSQALLTSGVHLGDFPLPSYLKAVHVNISLILSHPASCSGLLTGQWPLRRDQAAGHDSRWSGFSRGWRLLIPERDKCIASRL